MIILRFLCVFLFRDLSRPRPRFRKTGGKCQWKKWTKDSFILVFFSIARACTKREKRARKCGKNARSKSDFLFPQLPTGNQGANTSLKQKRDWLTKEKRILNIREMREMKHEWSYICHRAFGLLASQCGITSLLCCGSLFVWVSASNISTPESMEKTTI